MWALLFGNPLMFLVRGPMALFACIGASVALCGCMKCLCRCRAWRIRDCAVCKRILLCMGHDSFEEFELMVLVHEAMFGGVQRETLTTVVRVTAGAHVVKTQPSLNSVFQQPLHITIEQGTDHVVVDLLNSNNSLMATVNIDVDQIQNDINMQPEIVYQMRQRGKGILSPKVSLTMVASSVDDPEQGMIADGAVSDVAILVRQQLKKAQMSGGENQSEMDVLKEACAGPLELFEGLGYTQKVYVAVIGPPMTRRWVMGIWRNQHDFLQKERPVQEVQLLKIQGIQADKKRNDVFIVHHFDESRARQKLTFQRVDRNRDVWVEILHIVTMKAREQAKWEKDHRPGHRPRSQVHSSRPTSDHY